MVDRVPAASRRPTGTGRMVRAGLSLVLIVAIFYYLLRDIDLGQVWAQVTAMTWLELATLGLASAKLAVVGAALRPAPLSGLLLLGPGLLPKVNLPPARRVSVAVAHLVAPTARLPIPLTPELYTTNPQYLDVIRADRLRLLEATAQFFWETARLDRRRRRASAGLDLPLLVLQGEDDAMMDVRGTRRWFSRLGLEDKTYLAYAGAGHTLDFEPDRAPYLVDMLTWLSTRVFSRSTPRTGGA